jgi:hypothetical protein
MILVNKVSNHFYIVQAKCQDDKKLNFSNLTNDGGLKKCAILNKVVHYRTFSLCDELNNNHLH